jgi:acetyl esterase/lipase
MPLLLNAQEVFQLYQGEIPHKKNTEAQNNTINTTTIGKVDLVVVEPTLTVFRPEAGKSNGAAIVICPGGGYTVIARTHEGDSVALRFVKAGVTAFVLQYRLPNPLYVINKEVVPLEDAQHALAVVRERAGEWGIDPHRVGIMGASAGGHLASTIGTHFSHNYDAHAHKASFRPDFMVLLYPVISFADSITHKGSRFNLAGPEREDVLNDRSHFDQLIEAIPVDSLKKREYSNELQVTDQAPPAFIVHANDDEVVPVQNSILFIAALQEKKVRVQPLFYARGGHGFGLHNTTSTNDWMNACLHWLKEEGWLKQGRKG